MGQCHPSIAHLWEEQTMKRSKASLLDRIYSLSFVMASQEHYSWLSLAATPQAYVA